MTTATYAVLFALLAQASPASEGAPDKARAKILLHEGLAFNKRGEYAQALEKFQAAYAIFPSPKLWFNIGQVVGHEAEAAEAFEQFLALVPDALPEDKKIARSTVAQLGKQLVPPVRRAVRFRPLRRPVGEARRGRILDVCNRGSNEAGRDASTTQTWPKF